MSDACRRNIFIVKNNLKCKNIKMRTIINEVMWSITNPADVAWGCYSNQPNLHASWPVPVSDWLTNQVEVSGHVP